MESKTNLLKHVIFWLVLTTYLCVFDPVVGTFIEQVIGSFLIIARYAFAYYIVYLYILPRFYNSRFGFLTLIVAFLIYVMWSILTFVYFLKWYYPIFSDIITIMISDVIQFGIISILSLGHYQKKIAIHKILKQNEREKIVLFNELGFLKNQFNSQLTFNFLNNCYNKIQKDSVQTANAIATFSRILDYSLKNREDEKVLLRNEIEYIKDFIELQKLLSSEIRVQFLTSDTLDNVVYISPRILIVFVENSFKHGNIYSSRFPITIELKYDNNSLIYKVTNEKSKKRVTEVSGIGHRNLKQQLELFYKNKYTLEIEQDESMYSIRLKLLITTNSSSSEKKF